MEGFRMCHIIEFVTDEEATGITNTIDGSITIRRAKVIMTGKTGWMATEYHRNRFAGNSILYDTKEEAIQKGVQMLQKSEDSFNEFLAEQDRIRKRRVTS
jgi:hypothetical protein